VTHDGCEVAVTDTRMHAGSQWAATSQIRGRFNPEGRRLVTARPAEPGDARLGEIVGPVRVLTEQERDLARPGQAGEMYST
jgi:hypothetical protein